MQCLCELYCFLQRCLRRHKENSSSLFCLSLLVFLFRGSSESLDCPGTLADKAPRYVMRVVMNSTDQCRKKEVWLCRAPLQASSRCWLLWSGVAPWKRISLCVLVLYFSSEQSHNNPDSAQACVCRILSLYKRYFIQEVPYTCIISNDQQEETPWFANGSATIWKLVTFFSLKVTFWAFMPLIRSARTVDRAETGKTWSKPRPPTKEQTPGPPFLF